MSISRNPELTERARELRRNETKEERHLWYDFLSSYPIRFRRQRAIGPYIVDFYCAEANLTVELDGSQHYEPDGLAYDANRSRTLEKQGIKVLRFSNTEIMTQFEAVCTAIDQAVKEASAPCIIKP